MPGRAPPTPTAGALSAMRHVSQGIAICCGMPISAGHALMLYGFGVGDMSTSQPAESAVSQRNMCASCTGPLHGLFSMRGRWAKVGRWLGWMHMRHATALVA